MYKDKQKMRDYQNAWLRERQKDPEWAAKRERQKRAGKQRRIEGISRGKPVMSYPAYDYTNQIVICVSMYNRAKLAKIVIDRLYRTKAKALLYVLDDGSTEDTSWLEAFADKVIRQPHGQGSSLGVAENRIKLTSAALETGRPWIYHTDADCLHDVDWLPRLGSMIRHWGEEFPIMSLFNSPYHAQRNFSTSDQQMDNAKVCRRIECPGASFAIRADAIPDPAATITPERVRLHGAWDHCISVYTDGGVQRCLISTDSYCDHYGEGGIHGLRDDVPLNRTDRLIEDRPSIEPLL